MSMHGIMFKIRPTMILILNFLVIMKQCHHNTRVISMYFIILFPQRSHQGNAKSFFCKIHTEVFPLGLCKESFIAGGLNSKQLCTYVYICVSST